MTTRPRKHFELSAALIPILEKQPYIPPRSHSPAVIEALHALPHGSLVLWQQYVGAKTAEVAMTKAAKAPKASQEFLGKIVVAAGFGSAQFSLKGGRPVNRRNLKLPTLFNPETGEIMSPTARTAEMNRRLSQATNLSQGLFREMATVGKAKVENSHVVGRAIGEASLWVAISTHPEIGSSGSGPQIQEEVWKVCTDSLKASKQLNDTIGTNLSLAMLGGPVTGLTAYVEAEAPHEAHRILSGLRTAQSLSNQLASVDLLPTA